MPPPPGIARLDVDLCVIGAGMAGLSVAAGASQLGLKVVLCEQGKTGGSHLHDADVPSKALIAAAAAAQAAREAGRFGVQMQGPPVVDYAAVRAHVRRTIAAIAPDHSMARLDGLGVRVIAAPARFVSPARVEAGGFEIAARRFVIATGSRPALPPVPGLDRISCLTNETLFDLDTRPEHLLVIGGGATGCELAQAHARLGTKVTLVETATLLSGEDAEAVAVVRRALKRDGVELHEGTRVLRIERHAVANVAVLGDAAGNETPLACSHILLAAGRLANIDALGLDVAKIEAGPNGIVVDERLFTTNRAVLALGDCAGGPKSTHVAGWHAGIAIRNLCFRMRAKADASAIPRVTFTAPELAQVGLTEAQAHAAGIGLRLARWPFFGNDRAQATGEGEGFVKIVADAKGRVRGATLVGARAGELLAPWIAAVAQRRKLSAISGDVMPYPTLSETGRRAAGASFAAKLFSPGTRRLVRFLFRLPF